MYSLIRIKNELLSKSVFTLILLSLLFIFVFNIFDKSISSPGKFEIKISDEDKSMISKKEMADLYGTDSVIPVSEDADIEYIMKKDFGKKFLQGNFDGLIQVKRNNFKSGAGLINDRIAVKLVSDYIYFDLYDRIRAEKNISFDDYEKSLVKTKFANQILDINVNDRKIAESINKGIDYSSYIIQAILLVIGLHIGNFTFLYIKTIRNRGVLNRIMLSGVKERVIQGTEIMLAILKYLIFLFPMFFFMEIKLKQYVLVAFFFFINLLASYFLEKLSKTEEAFKFITNSLMILFLFIGMIIYF